MFEAVRHCIRTVEKIAATKQQLIFNLRVKQYGLILKKFEDKTIGSNLKGQRNRSSLRCTAAF